ncbi:hypothetical protein LZC95_31580 [Pendulispora brunnea]|uniref:RCC1-like domain-containing protein n=1 Tax=Pendulispora brunnea TaxID=2905690 RepID=A0ABZ2K2J3_9BACT
MPANESRGRAIAAVVSRHRMRVGILGGLAASFGVGIVAACGGTDADNGGAVTVNDAGTDRGSIITPPATHIPIGIAAGGVHACATMDDGRLFCWGNNRHGQLGNPQITELPDGSRPFDKRPVPSPQLASVANTIQVATGDESDEDGQPAEATCAILTDAQAQCWGQNRYRALGRANSPVDDDYKPHPEALPVSNLGPSQQIVTNGMTSCAVSADDGWCWGRGLHWTDGGGGKFPTKVDGKGHPIKQIAIGHLFGAVLDEIGNVYGWGDNSRGQLAISPDYMFTDALEIAAGNYTACARVRSGEVMCIGSNTRGMLGRDKFDAPQDSVAAPVILPTNRSATKLAMASDHACALLDDGTIWCWGNNRYGGLGAGQINGNSVEPQESSLPLKVQGLSNPAVAIAAGIAFTCALLSDHTVMCWGLNRDGTLGQGSLDEAPHISPVRVQL